MWHLGSRVIGHGGDGLVVGLDHLGGLVQPQQLYDSMSRHGGNGLIIGLNDLSGLFQP